MTSSRAGAELRQVRAPRRHVLRTPLFPQHETTECGAACLGTVLAHFGRWVNMDELRDACAVNRDGTTALDIVRAANGYGLEVNPQRREPEQLKDSALPSILFWEFNHFVVLEGFGRDSFYVNDPADGRRTVDAEAFSRSFTGIALSMQPGPGFERGGTRPGVMRRAMPWLADVSSPLAFVALCGVLLALPGLALPIVLTLFVDHVLSGGGGDRDWGALVVAAAAGTAAMSYALVWLQQRSLRRLAIRLSAVHAERLVSRLFRLPGRFFSQRLAGDLLARLQLVDGVAAGLSTQFVGALVELVMSAGFVVLMVVYDPLLAAVVVSLGLLNAAATKLIGRRRVDESRLLHRERALLMGVGAAGIRNIDALRSTASEDDFFARWTGHQASELVARQKFAGLGRITSSLPFLTQLLVSAAVFGIGGLQVISGEMTLGALMGFFVVAGSFLRPVSRFVLLAESLAVLESSLQRIDDVAHATPDPGFAAVHSTEVQRVSTLDGKLRLDGHLEIRDVTFGYRPHHPPLIAGLSLSVMPGRRVAVIGPTGSGKSTLMRLISGEYRPWSGQVLVDGVPMSEVPRDVLTSSLSIVDQHIVLFAGTVRENLTMWNPEVADHRIVAATRDALIHDEISGRAGGYDAAVHEGGVNFSHGQRQRLEIARALVSNPSVILLDEATSRLDSVTELGIDDALRRRGCACLIVAHRLSTVRDCDEIVVLDQGQVVQRGVHDDLMDDADGLYRRLVGAE